MQEFGEIVIRQTIEMLFEEHSADNLMMDHFFQNLLNFSEHFDVSHTNIVNMIIETAERKKFENGAVAAQFLSFMRQVKKGPWQPPE